MNLLRFRVTNFRSVEDSGWIAVDDVTALIGTNESGKTNILLPLWKLNPAREGEIDLLADYPRKLYNKFRSQDPPPIFVEAVFDIGEELAGKLAPKAALPAEQLREVTVKRRFDGVYFVEFSGAKPVRAIPLKGVKEIVSNAQTELVGLSPLKSEEQLKPDLLAAIAKAMNTLNGQGEVAGAVLDDALKSLLAVSTENTPKTSAIVPRYLRLIEELGGLKKEISHVHPNQVKELRQAVLDEMPNFVYYSNYGNLDSEIYLPYVIKNLARTDLGGREQARARTLKVLFEFVKLQPEEILELGKELEEPVHPNQRLSEEDIAAANKRKKERSILLTSASVELTEKFRNWWKRGDYTFRFEADGDHFRIWVSDDKRPEPIELEGRSTGLQWFLSFYLVFLVEQSDAHAGSILLLDEPGLSLHPMAQRDLSAFFDGLAQTNQLLYTSHSPFLIDADRLDRARKVFVADDGTSKITSDLSSSEGSSEKRSAGYAVHAAVGLTLAESMLIGCTPVVVEGPSDQHYLSAIKVLLISAGRVNPSRELVFPPAGGTKGVRAISSILFGRDDELPMVLFDSDLQGRNTAKQLREGLYAGQHDLVLELGHFIKLGDCEIEDLFPVELLAEQLDRWLRPENAFSDVVVNGKPIVPQIESWAEREGIKLEKPGWKVELAKRVKRKLLVDGHKAIDSQVLDRWTTLFDSFQPKK
jgi:hypothetical protein